MSISDHHNGHKSEQQMQDKQLNDDEALIQSLYDDLAAQDSSSADYPSKAADDKILAAAHRSVRSSPKIVITKRAWYVPVASAASVILVVSLFFNQLQDPVMQSELSFSGNSLTEAVQYNDEANEGVNIETSAPMLQHTPALSVKSEERLFKQKGINKKQQSVKRISQQGKEEKKQLKRMAASSYRTSSSDELLLETTEATQIKEVRELTPLSLERPITLMTKQVYNQLINLKSHWLFISEDKEFYLIQVVKKGDENRLYKLDKKAYYINRSMQKNKTKRSLKELGKLTEN